MSGDTIEPVVACGNEPMTLGRLRKYLNVMYEANPKADDLEIVLETENPHIAKCSLSRVAVEGAESDGFKLYLTPTYCLDLYAGLVDEDD